MLPFNGLYHDFTTKEYRAGKSNRSEKWEMCRGMGLSFGYNENEGDDQLISLPDLISLLVGTVANNGNLLLNIGPKADGTIPEEQVKRLLALGEWLNVNGEGIYGTRCSRRESEERENGVKLHYTRKGEDVYIFADGLKDGENILEIPGVCGKVQSLCPELETESQITEKGLRLYVKNYRKDMYVVCFKGEGLE